MRRMNISGNCISEEKCISEETPLIFHEDSNFKDRINGNEDIEAPKEEITLKELEAGLLEQEWTPREIFVTIVSFVAASFALCVIFTIPTETYPTGWFLSNIFNILAIMIPTYSAYQEQKVTDAEVLQKSIEDYKRKMEEVEKTKNILMNRGKLLNVSTKRLGVLKESMEEIRGLQADAIEELGESLTERQQILKVDETNLLAETIDNVMELVLKCDDDQNMALSEKEVNTVIRKLEGIHNVDFKDELFHQKIREYGCDLGGVMRLINDMFDADPTLDSYLHSDEK